MPSYNPPHTSRTPHTFQQSGRMQVNRLLNAGRAPVLCMPTGTGKTFTAGLVTGDRVKMGERIFVLTPSIEIHNQWVREFHEQGIPAGTINDKGVTGRGMSVYVAMPMSLNNMLSVLPEKFAPDGIINDECHHSEAASWLNIHRFYPRAWRIGLTATPERYDGLPLSNTYTDIVSTITPREAIDGGFLSDYLLIVPEQYALDVQVQNGEYNLDEQAAQLGKPRIIGDVITQYSGIFAGLPCLVACSTHEHARKMTEEFKAAGWNFEHIHSGLPPYERARMLKGIRKGTINGLCTVGIGIEGLDIPGLYGLIWLRRTMSVTVYLQFIGRVLRRAEGKKYGIILDPVGNVFIHGRPDMERVWSLEGRAARVEAEEGVPKMKICPACKVMNAEINVLCHICGYDFTSEREKGPGRAFPAMVDGKLVILDADRLEARKEAIKEALEGQRTARVGGAHQGGDFSGEGAESEHGGATPGRDRKIALLKNGLKSKGGLFSGAVKEWL